jgi:hypothetical protein
MQFLAILRSNKYHVEEGKLISSSLIAVPMIIEDVDAAYETLTTGFNACYAKLTSSIDDFLDGEHYNYYGLYQLATPQIAIPELASYMLGSSIGVDNIIPMTDSVITGKWLVVNGMVTEMFQSKNLLQKSIPGFMTYLQDEMSKDQIRAQRSIFKHYLRGAVQIDFENSEPANNNLAITYIDFAETGPIPSKDFVALACLYENYTNHVSSLNSHKIKEENYRVSYYQILSACATLVSDYFKPETIIDKAMV